MDTLTPSRQDSSFLLFDLIAKPLTMILLCVVVGCTGDSTDPQSQSPTSLATDHTEQTGMPEIFKLEYLPDNCDLILAVKPKAILTSEAGSAFYPHLRHFARKALPDIPGLTKPTKTELVNICFASQENSQTILFYVQQEDEIKLEDFFHPEQLEHLTTDKLNGYTIKRTEKSLTLCFLDPKTCLFAPLDTLKHILERNGPAHLSEIVNHELAEIRMDAQMGMVFTPVVERQLTALFEPRNAKPFFTAVQLGRVELLLNPNVSIRCSFQCESAATGDQISSMLGGALADFKVPRQPNRPSPRSVFASRILDHWKLTRSGETVLGTLDIPLPTYQKIIAETKTIDAAQDIGISMHHLIFAIDTLKHSQRELPPDRGGKKLNPGLSWRVRVLPYIDDFILYTKFNHDEPWDSPHNKALIAEMPELYGPKDSNGRTRFVTLRHPHSLFPEDVENVTIDEIEDGAEQTIALVHANEESAVIWTKPDDLEYDPNHPKEGLDSGTGYFWAAFADRSSQQIKLSIDDDLLRAMVTRNGKEPLTKEQIEATAPEPVR